MIEFKIVKSRDESGRVCFTLKWKREGERLYTNKMEFLRRDSALRFANDLVMTDLGL